jgi:phage terminase large subunit-like protein
MGMPLLPWQEYVINDGCKIKDNGEFVSKTNLLIIARQNGKTTLTKFRILAGLFLWDEQLQIATAQNRDVALETFRSVVEMIDGFSWLSNKVKAVTRANGREEIELKGGQRFKIVAAMPGSARGLSANTVYIDEARMHKTTDAFAALAYTMQASKNPSMWVTSNAGDITSTLLNQLRARALHKIDNNTDDDIAYWEWSAEPGLKLSDRKGWVQANPALGHTITENTLQSRMNDNPNIIATEMLCQWVDVIQSPWSAGDWNACQQSSLKLSPDRPTWIGVEISPDRTGFAIVGSQILDDKSIAVALMDLQNQENAIDDLKIADHVAQWAKKYNAEAIILNKFSGDSVAAKLRMASIHSEIITGAKYYQACDETLGAMAGARITHAGQPELTASVNACIKKTTEAGSWYVSRRKNSTAAIAMMLAIHKATERQHSGEFEILVS